MDYDDLFGFVLMAFIWGVLLCLLTQYFVKWVLIGG